MKKIKSIAVVILVITATVFGLTACHNKKCKDGEKCEKASCCKDEQCCDKCSDKCTTEDKCCDKCKVGEYKACCAKEDKCCDKCKGDCTAEMKCCDKCKAGEEKACCNKDKTTADKTIDSVSVKEIDEKATTAMYVCPMHKDITSDKPGKCSKCGMELEKRK